MTRLLTFRGWLYATTALLALTAWGRHELKLLKENS